MSSAAVSRSASPVKPQAPSPAAVPESFAIDASETSTQNRIAVLAYQLWEQHGSPEGSSEQDWAEAEEIVQSQASTAAAGS